MTTLIARCFTDEANLDAAAVEAIATKFRDRIGGVYTFIADYVIADHQHLYPTTTAPTDTLGRPLEPCAACGHPGAHWAPAHVADGHVAPGRYTCEDTTR